MKRLLLTVPIGHIGLIGLIGIIFLSRPSSSSFAAAPKNTISVMPQLIQLDLSQEPPEAEYTYTNNTNQTVELDLSIADVKELEDRGIPDILDSASSKGYKYGLSSWASFSNKNIVLLPHESKKITVFIDGKRLSLGGHYASILAEVKQQNDNKTVKLRAILSSLLFVRSGTTDETEQAEIVDFKAISDYMAFPSQFSFKLQNQGNVDLTPYGLLAVYNPWGQLVAKVAVNEDSLITLPDSERKYVIKINQTEGFLIPGQYKAKLSIHFGKKNVDRAKELTFTTYGSGSSAGMGIGLIVVFLVLLAAVRIIRKRLKK